MESESQDACPASGPRERTMSTISSHSYKLNMAPTPSDSGLYTCSSSNSECPESDNECFHAVLPGAKDEAFQLALAEGRRLRSELERLKKSEQWYKNEMRQQRATRLEDLEKIYTQERKFIRENQRLQHELLQLYERCSCLEKQMEEQRCLIIGESSKKKLNFPFEVEHGQPLEQQQEHYSGIIEEQAVLIKVLRQQKKLLLGDLKCLAEEKDRKITELQRILAGLEVDHKQIVKKCKTLSEERSQLEKSLTRANRKLSSVLEENLQVQKTEVDLREQLEAQEELVKLKENEIAQLAEKFRSEMSSEKDLDEVHRLSMTYHGDISQKTMEIVALKTQLSAMQCELQGLQELQAHSDQQQRQIEQLQFCLNESKLEKEEISQSDGLKTSQIETLKTEIDMLLQENKAQHKAQLDKQQELANICLHLQTTEAQHARLQAEFKETHFKLQMLEMDYNKLTFQRGHDQHEITVLRQKLRDYLQQTADLSERMKVLEQALRRAMQENMRLEGDLQNKKSLFIDTKLVVYGTATADEMGEKLLARQTIPSTHSQLSKDQSAAMETTEFARSLSHLVSKLVDDYDNSVNMISEEMKEKKLGKNFNTETLTEMGRGEADLEAIIQAQKRQIQILYEKLLETDANLYKIERKYRGLCEESDEAEVPDVGPEPVLSKDLLDGQGRCENKEVQCNLGACKGSDDRLQLQLAELHQRVEQGLERESAAKQEKILLLNNLTKMQNSKMQLMKSNQEYWEDMLESLQALHTMEAETRKELELKRMELEDLNRVFRKQNDQLRRLEQMAAETEAKERQPQDIIEELNTLKRELHQRRAESQDLKQYNQILSTENAQLQIRHQGNNASQIADYEDEIEHLKNDLRSSSEDKQEMAQRIMELESELAEVRSRQRQAILMPEPFAFEAAYLGRGAVGGSHLDIRILARVLESEHERKMQRYNHHIHSLLSNVQALKRSLKLSEERTANLSEQQMAMQEQLNVLQLYKTMYEDMCAKHGKGQETIKELKEALAIERKRYESSDLAKITQSQSFGAYEVSNLIDDYKKLIQQSSSATKRPTTSAILDLIQRSNQCQPSLSKLEGSIGDLCSDVQAVLTTVAQRIPSSCLMNAASLTVPPSLMDELRAAAEF